MLTKPAIRFLAITVAISTSGCAARSETAELSGASADGAMGAMPGHTIGSVSGARASMTTRKAVMDAVLGGAAGAVIGRSFDNLAAQLRTDLPHSDVSRVGEGIIVTLSTQRLFDPKPGQAPDTAALRAFATRVARTNGIELLIVADPDPASTDPGSAAFRATLIRSKLIHHGVPAARIIAGQRPAQERPEQRIEIALYATREQRDAILREYGRQ